LKISINLFLDIYNNEKEGHFGVSPLLAGMLPQEKFAERGGKGDTVRCPLFVDQKGLFG